MILGQTTRKNFTQNPKNDILSGITVALALVPEAVAFAFVAGIMIFISLDELLPAAREYGKHHLAAYGLVAGMLVMALSLLLLL